MAGWEELTPEQIIFIVEFIGITLIIFSISQIVRALITLRISKNVKHLELMIEKKYDEGIKKPSLFENIKVW